MTLYYPAVVLQDEVKTIVKFLDLDQCTGQGTSLEDALEDARYNAMTWIQTEMEEGNDLPLRTEIADLSAEEQKNAKMIAIIMPRNNDWDE
jgi:predicted RNase H-like HicB family nuclease